MKRFLLGSLVSALYAVACGGNVVVDGKSSSTTNGTGATTGTGGASTTTNTSTGTGTGAQPPTCSPSVLCPSGSFCSYAPPGSCGLAGLGQCVPEPQGCPADCPGACGCDGQFFCNACQANQAGTDVTSGPCGLADGGPPPPPPDQYVAWSLQTNVERYAIAKLEYSAGRCIVFVLANVMGANWTGINTDPGWSIEQAWIQQDVGACAQMVGNFPMATGQSFKPSQGGGVISGTPPTFPCFVTVQAKLSFPSGLPAWVPAGDFLDTAMLAIMGTACGG